MFHPWRRLRAQPHIRLSWRELAGRLGETEGNVIRMHPHQSQVQRRCTIAHELAHVELGHRNGCDDGEEVQATRLAARWLVGMDDLLDALRWAEELEEVAECLWVDEPTLLARLDGLDADERQRVVDLHHEMERPC